MTAEAYPTTSLNGLEGQHGESGLRTRYTSVFGEKAASASGLAPVPYSQLAAAHDTSAPSLTTAHDVEPKKLSRFQKYTSTLFGEDASAVLGAGNEQSKQAVIEAMAVLFYRNKKQEPTEKTLRSFRVSFNGFFDGLSNQQIVDLLRENGINKAPSSLAPFFSIAKSSIKNNVQPEAAFEVLLDAIRANSSAASQEVKINETSDEWLEPSDDDIRTTADISTELEDVEIDELAQISEREVRRVSLPRATGRVAVNGGIAANLRNPRPFLDLTPINGTLIDNSEDEEEGPWQEKALCAQTDPEAFFPEKGGSTREAKRICLGCEVKDTCLNYALAHDERFGIWGGLSERERRRLKNGIS